MRTLCILFLSVLVAQGAIQADAILHMEGVSRGLLQDGQSLGFSGTGVGADFVGDGGLTDFNRHYCKTNFFTNYLPVIVNGTTYGQGTNCIFVDMSTNTSRSHLRLYMGDPFDEEYQTGNVLAFGFVQYNITNESTVNLDTFSMNDAGGDWTIMQSRARPSDVQITAHSSDGALGSILLDQGKPYFFEKFRDGTNGVIYVRFRDPANGMAQVGEDISITFPENSSVGFWAAHIQGGYLQNVPGFIVWDSIAFRYHATGFLSEHEIHGTTPRTLNASRANVGRVQGP